MHFFALYTYIDCNVASVPTVFMYEKLTKFELPCFDKKKSAKNQTSL